MQIGERRQVSVLFCDLVDSVNHSSQVDPEEWLEVVDVYYEKARHIIHSFKGYILDYVGDGIAAYFGYPVSHEEAACDAVKAAIRMSDEIPQLQTPMGIKLQTRIGVATGLVVVKAIEIGDNRSKISLIGDTPNLAARLQGLAQPNAIVISSTTKNVTDGVFECESLGVHQFKGFADPLEVFRVTQVKFSGSRSQIRVRRSGHTLYGRELELDVLREFWQVAKEGSAQFVLVKGDAGIGKSRLVETIRNGLVMAGEKHQTWFCSPNHALTALFPIVELLMRLAGFELKDSLDVRRTKFNDFLQMFGVDDPTSLVVMAELMGLSTGDVSAIKSLSPEKKKEIRLHTIIQMLAKWSAGEPILIVVEDLHWIDSTTLELIDDIHVNQQLTSCMILATARPEFVPDRQETCHLLTLERLTVVEALNLCHSIDSQGVITADLARQIVHRSDGNPLFIEELTQSVIEGITTNQAKGDSDLVSIPETLQDSLVARLDRLGEARRLACIGAVIGRSFSKAMILAVSDQPKEAVEESLFKLLDSGLATTVSTAEGVGYQFRHALIRDSAYAIILKRERQDLHRRTAEILRNQFQAICEAEPQLLAYHCTESGSYDQAIPLWMLAGQRMADNAAHAEAVAHFQRALALIKSQPEEPAYKSTELQLQIGIAVSLSASRGYAVPEVGEALNEAENIAENIGDAQAKFSILRGICNFKIVAGDMDSAETICIRCGDLAATTIKPEHQIETDTPYGYVCFSTGRLEEAAERLENGVRLYDQFADEQLPYPCPQDPKIVCLSSLLMVYNAQGHGQDLQRVEKALRAHMEAMSLPFQSVFALVYLAWHHLDANRYLEAYEAARLCHSLCDVNGYTFHGANSKLMAAIALANLDSTNLQPAISQAQDAIALLARLGCQHSIPSRMGELAKLHAMAGEIESARQMSREAVDLAKRIDDHFFVPVILCRQLEYELLALSDSADGRRNWKLERIYADALGAARSMNAKGFEAMIEDVWSSA
jgi:class 3 adenylate cyclase